MSNTAQIPASRYEAESMGQSVVDRVRAVPLLAYQISQRHRREDTLDTRTVLQVIDYKGILLVDWCSTYCRQRWAHCFQQAWELFGEEATLHYVEAGDPVGLCFNGAGVEGATIRFDARQAYLDYLRTPQWYAIRNRVMTKGYTTCARCDALAENVHHKTYERLGRELESDLEPLCRACHEKEHRVAKA